MRNEGGIQERLKILGLGEVLTKFMSVFRLQSTGVWKATRPSGDLSEAAI